MNDKRKEYLKKWREDNKEHIRHYRKEYAKTHDSSFKKLQDKYKQLQQENKQLQERIEYLERSNNRREDTILEQRQEISDLEDNCLKLKHKLSKIETLVINHNCDTGDIYYKYNSRFLKSELKQKILEIVYEQGSDE